MLKSTFEIPKMDCPSEEQMIRMKIEKDPLVKGLEFDLSTRTLDVLHEGGGNCRTGCKWHLYGPARKAPKGCRPYACELDFFNE